MGEARPLSGAEVERLRKAVALGQSAAVRLRALRGATTVSENACGAILEATEDLVREMMERNSLACET